MRASLNFPLLILADGVFPDAAFSIPHLEWTLVKIQRSHPRAAALGTSCAACRRVEIMTQVGQEHSRSDKFERLSSGRSARAFSVRSDQTDDKVSRAPPDIKDSRSKLNRNSDSEAHSGIAFSPPAGTARSPRCAARPGPLSCGIHHPRKGPKRTKTSSYLVRLSIPTLVPCHGTAAMRRSQVPKASLGTGLRPRRVQRAPREPQLAVHTQSMIPHHPCLSAKSSWRLKTFSCKGVFKCWRKSSRCVQAPTHRSSRKHRTSHATHSAWHTIDLAECMACKVGLAASCLQPRSSTNHSCTHFRRGCKLPSPQRRCFWTSNHI